MANKILTKARADKNDEFYTQINDIQREVNAYIEYNEDVFKDKVVLLPCDDPEWSKFTEFFILNFSNYGLKKLISTSYAHASKMAQYAYQPSPMESNDDNFDANKSETRGKIFVLERREDDQLEARKLKWSYLEGDGDFRSDEVKALRDEADIIITNPPFSLLRDFLSWILEANKQFLIIGNINVATCKGVFELVRDNKIWFGASYPKNFLDHNGMIQTLGNTCWYSNIEHGIRHEKLPLLSMKDNIKHSKSGQLSVIKKYRKFDNFDAIEVPTVDVIPCDYEGLMGVPTSYLCKYCPEQFEIVGITKTWNGFATKIYPKQIQVTGKTRKNVTKLNDGCTIEVTEIPDDTYYIVEDKMYIQLYPHILIRKK